MQAKRDEMTVNRDEMQVKGKQQPVVNVRGVEDAAPYNCGGRAVFGIAGRPRRVRRGEGTPPYGAGAQMAAVVGVGVLDDPGRGGYCPMIPPFPPIPTISCVKFNVSCGVACRTRRDIVL